MLIEPLLEARPDSMQETPVSDRIEDAIVLSTRVRLARNLESYPFPSWAQKEQRRDILSTCINTLNLLPQMQEAVSFNIEELSKLERQILVERHLISRELSEEPVGAGVLINRDQTCSIMINEEDHLRIQYMSNGLDLQHTWKTIDAIDTAIEKQLNYAFSLDYGYLTACPTNVGTGMRISAMMHLPALVIAGSMEKVIHAVNQAGIVVRGLFGEGSEASGSIFQISNQQTLGQSEKQIIQNVQEFLNIIIQREKDTREKLIKENPEKLFNKIGRAYGIFKYARLIGSEEAMNLFSLLRLAIDLGILDSPDSLRRRLNQLLVESQPGHVQYAVKKSIRNKNRDRYRAIYFRKQFAQLSSPNFDKLLKINHRESE